MWFAGAAPSRLEGDMHDRDHGGHARAVPDVAGMLASQIMERLLLITYSMASGTPRDWQAEVAVLRRELQQRLEGTPPPLLVEQLDDAWEDARAQAEIRMRLCGEGDAAHRLPQYRPFILEQVLDRDWWPEPQV
jgi:hypothetical protein